MPIPPNVISGQAIGTGIAVKDSTELAQLSTQGMSVGTSVWSAADASFFTLSVSSAALSSEVVQVFGIDGWRWIKGGGSGGSNTFTDSTPSVFASPAGDDSFPGTEGKPVQTLYRATQIAIENGLYNINFTDDTAIGGPVPDQGLWLRGDEVQVPGWINIGTANLIYTGIGRQIDSPFERAGTAGITGYSQADYYSPSLWVCGTEYPIEFHRLLSWVKPDSGVASPVRLGWDYIRRNDGSREDLNITSASRSGGITTFTVDLSTATPFTMLTASRFVDAFGSLRVRATLQLGSNQNCTPWTAGTPIRIVTSDSNFPSIDTTVVNQSDQGSVTVGSTVTIDYLQTGSVIGVTPVTGGTIRSHGCQAKERISTSITGTSEFVSTVTMRVTFATTTTINVADPYGYAPRSATVSVGPGSFGTLAKQERTRHALSACDFYDCNIQANALQTSTDDFRYGASVDIGTTNAHPIRFYNSYIGGYSILTTTDTSRLDLDRVKCAVLADPGAATYGGGIQVEFYNINSINGGLRSYCGQATADTYVSYWLQDSGGSTSPSFPTVSIVEGNPFGYTYIDRAFAYDETTTSAISLCAGLDPNRTHVGLVDGISSLSSSQIVTSLSPYLGPTNTRSGLWNDPSISPATTPTPWETGQRTVWTGGLAIQHRGINRSLGALSARYGNIFTNPASWPSLSGVTITFAGPAPDGSNTAIEFNNTSGVTKQFQFENPKTWTGNNGDRVVFGAWMNSATGIINQFNLNLGPYDSTILFDGVNELLMFPPLANTGWQWMNTVATISGLSGGTTGRYILQMFLPPGITYLYAPTLVQVPASVATYDAYEYGLNTKGQPFYLQPGMTGTMEKTKLVAHGGLGTAARYTIGVASGNITLGSANGNAVELFDESGNSIGVLPMLSYTVNP